jgi:uncharacterized tellurite resistance protein B-like protein
MIDSIKALFDRVFEAPADAPTEHDLHVAAAALLLEVGHADFDISEQELTQIAQLLRGAFGLNDEETQTLLRLAVQAHDRHASVFPFVRLINERFAMAEKCRIVEDMWRVAYADRRLDKYEEYQIRRLAELLHVPHQAYIRAKLRAKRQAMGGGGHDGGAGMDKD